MKTYISRLFVIIALLAVTGIALAQGTTFTYQGRLNSSGASANGNYDFQFKLYTDPAGANPAGSPFSTNDVPVTNGLFMVQINFGPGIFTGSNYWLEINVRTNNGGSYTMLSPLQEITPTPYAIMANAASNVLGTVTASQLSGRVASANLPTSPTFSGTVTASSFTGNGGNLTNIPLASLNSDGTFGLSTNGLAFSFCATNAVGGQPTQILPAFNLNGTSHTDLVVPNEGSNTVSVLTNTGAGGFVTSTTLPAGNGPVCVAVADLNNDRPDIAVVNASGGSVIIYTNMGGGQFYSNQTIGVNFQSSWIAAVTNLSGAGKTGLLVLGSSEGTVEVLTNNGAGILSSNATLSAGLDPETLAVADYNNDGYPDFAVANNGGLSIIIFTNNGAGVLFSNATVSLGQFPNLLVAADVNGDGWPDLVCTCPGVSSLFVLTNNHGVFTVASTISNAYTTGLAVGDFNGDGLPDLLCSANENTLQVALNTGNGTFSLSPPIEFVQSGISLNSVAAVDINGDGLADIIAVTYTGALFEFLNESGMTSASISMGAGSFRRAPGWTGVPDWIGGSTFNEIDPMIAGSVIDGGGAVSNINHISADYSSIGGGEGNSIGSQGSYAVIGGGYFNTNNGSEAFMGTGAYNRIANFAQYSVLVGGNQNSNAAIFDTLVGGADNTVIGQYACIVGGIGNTAGGTGSFIGGGGTAGLESYGANSANGGASVVTGGLGNQANGTCSTVPGGQYNVATGNFSFAAGQQAQALHSGTFVWADSQNAIFASTSTNQFLIRAQNGVGINTNNPSAALSVNGAVTATSFSGDGSGLTNLSLNNANYSALAGGQNNNIGGSTDSVIGGGTNNILTNVNASAIVGGQGNINNASQSIIGNGSGNIIETGAYYCLLGSGGGNVIRTNSNTSVLSGGYHNAILAYANASSLSGGYGNTNTGPMSTIPGGQYNIATTNSFAAGSYAQATNFGAFVWSDGSGTVTTSTNNNSVTMRANGGFRFISSDAANDGVFLASGSGSWTSLSDRSSKEHFTPVNTEEVLRRVVALPVTTWNYKRQAADIRHIGPTAQDFKAAFAVGETDTGISTVDENGVALAAIQGLNQKLEKKDAEIHNLKAQNDSLARRLEELEQKVQSLAQSK